ncbi:uncharacterized protein METZ01_LOCUS185304, partial [marine metagenome]
YILPSFRFLKAVQHWIPSNKKIRLQIHQAI